MVGVISCEQDNCSLHPPSYIDTPRLRYVTFFLSSILISLTSPTRTAPPIPCICDLRPSSSTRRSRWVPFSVHRMAPPLLRLTRPRPDISDRRTRHRINPPILLMPERCQDEGGAWS